MIVFYFLKMLILIGSGLTAVFGRADILPFGSDSYFVLFFGWINYIATDMWPLHYVLQCFALYIGWRIGVLVVRLLLGHRAPVS